MGRGIYAGAARTYTGPLLAVDLFSVELKCKPSYLPGIAGIFLASHSITADNMYNCGLEAGVS